MYSERPYPYDPPPEGLPGNIIIRGNGVDQRFVIALIAQYYPGHPRFPNSSRGGFAARQKAFQHCLDKIAQLPYLTSVAFPWQIGCGAAGGDWSVYRQMIEKFAEATDVPVRIYRLPSA